MLPVQTKSTPIRGLDLPKTLFQSTTYVTLRRVALMSTNTHEQSKTCTDIVNDLSQWAAVLEGAEDVNDPRMVASHMRVRAAQLKRLQSPARPAPDKPGAPVMFPGGARGEAPGGAARHPGAAAAVATLQAEGCVWDEGAQAWQSSRPGPAAIRQAAEAVVRARQQGLVVARMEGALNALADALSSGPRPAFPPAWDAEECRNAALEVLRVARTYPVAPPVLDALDRLGRAVQREQ